MIINLETHDAIDILVHDTFANWSYEGAKLLVEYLEEKERDRKFPYAFDHIRIRTEWSEMAYCDVWDAYSEHLKPLGILEDEKILEWLNQFTVAIEVPANELGIPTVLFMNEF